MIVRELVTRLGFQFSKKGLNDFEKGVEKAKQSMTELSNQTLNFGKAFSRISAIVSVVQGAMVATAVSTARNVDELKELAAKANTSVRALQEFEAIAQSAGVKSGEFTRSIVNLNKSIGNARLGVGQSARDFIRLGISIRNSNGTFKDSSDIYVNVANKLKNLKSSSKEMIVAQRLLGTSSFRLIDTFAKSSGELAKQREEIRKIITVFDEKAIADSNKFIRNFDKLKLIFKSIKDTLAINLMPALNKTIEATNEWYIANREIINQDIKSFAGFLTSSLGFVAKALAALYSPIQKAINFFGGFTNVISVVAVAFTVQLIPAFVAAARSFSLLTASLATNPLIAIGLAIGVIVNELQGWVTGNESVIENVLGSWESFRDKFINIIDSSVNYFKNSFSSLKNWFVGIADVLTTPFSATKREQKIAEREKLYKEQSEAKRLQRQGNEKLQVIKVKGNLSKLADLDKKPKKQNDEKIVVMYLDSQDGNMNVTKIEEISKNASIASKVDNSKKIDDKKPIEEQYQGLRVAKVQRAKSKIPTDEELKNSESGNFITNIFKSLVGKTPTSTAAAKTQKTNYVNQSITENITVNVPAGTSAEQSESIASQVADAIQEQFRYNFVRAIDALGGK